MSIYKRGKSFYYEFWHRGVRYGPKSLGPISREAAKTQYLAIRLAIMEGRPLESERPVTPTLRHFLEEFLPWYMAHRRPQSSRLYRATLGRWASLYGQVPMDGLTNRMIEGQAARWLEQGWSPWYVNNHLRSLKHCLRTAAAWGLMPESRIPRFRLVPTDEQVPRVLSASEEIRLLHALPERLRSLVQVALHTGLRHSELLALQWRDIDWSAGYLLVRHAKNRRSRYIPMNNVVRQALATLPLGGPEQRVFGYHSIHQSFIRARRRVGLEDVTIHSLRHTFATRAIMAGVDLRTLQRWLGHQHLTMTERYTHPTPAHERAAIMLLEHTSNRNPISD